MVVSLWLGACCQFYQVSQFFASTEGGQDIAIMCGLLFLNYRFNKGIQVIKKLMQERTEKHQLGNGLRFLVEHVAYDLKSFGLIPSNFLEKQLLGLIPTLLTIPHGLA